MIESQTFGCDEAKKKATVKITYKLNQTKWSTFAFSTTSLSQFTIIYKTRHKEQLSSKVHQNKGIQYNRGQLSGTADMYGMQTEKNDCLQVQNVPPPEVRTT